MADFKYREITEKTISAAFRVHRVLGNGFQEVIYQRARALEFNSTSLQSVREFEMPYLKAYNLEIGLLLNFGSKRLEFHWVPNKKCNPLLIQHPNIPIHPKNHSLDK